MVDCGSLRCAQERRSLRRDLQSLSKKLPVILGLESIAAVFAKADDDEQPQSSEQPAPVTRDFQLSSRCFYCEKKLPNVYKRIHRIINDAQLGKENKGKICLRSLQDLIPFCLDFYTHGFGRELFSECVKNHFILPPPPPPQSQDHHQELATTSGLSVGSSHDLLLRPLAIPANSCDNDPKSSKQSISGNHGLPFKPPVEKFANENRNDRKREAVSLRHCIPETVLDPSMAVKKELDSFSDRGLVGLPLAEETDFYNAFLNQLPRFSQIEKNPIMDYKDLSFPFALQNFLLNSALTHPAYFSHDSALLKELHLAQIRRMHNLDGVNRKQPRPAHGSQLKMPILISIVRKLVHERVMEIKRLHRKNRAKMMDLDSDEEQPSKAPIPSLSPFPSPLSSFSHNKRHLLNGSLSNIVSDGTISLNRFGKVNECSRIGNTLKDIIVKGISEKVKFKDMSSDENSCPSSPIGKVSRQHLKSGMSYGCLNSIPNLSSPTLRHDPANVEVDQCSPPKRFKKDGVKSKNNSKKTSSQIVGSPPSNGKKTRPKRGQYRKYNSQLLMDAVRAVQSGEMSVHRAGSFYGVPHSTLEYKVKERHLLRQRKGKDSSVSPPSSLSSALTKNDHASLKMTIDLGGDSSPTPSEGTSASSSRNIGSPSSVVGVDGGKKAGFSHHLPPDSIKIPEQQPVSLCMPLALPSPGSASSSQDSARKDIPSTVTWLQPYLSSTGPPGSNVGVDSFHPLPSVPLDNSASELLRKLQHKVQSNNSGKSFPADNIPSLPFPKDSVFALDNGTSASVSGRLPVFNQS